MSDLSTANQRKKLKPRSAPYWTKIAKGKALGYYATPSDRPGRWQARVHVRGVPRYRFKALGVADDLPHVEADGEEVLSYAEAFDAARRWDPYDEPEPEDGDQHGDDGDDEDADEQQRYEEGTVGDVCQQYIRWSKKHRRGSEGVRRTLEAHVLPDLGDVPLDRLTSRRLRAWHERLAEKPAHVRTSKYGKKKRRTRVAKTDDEKRARKVTANNILRVLKAALHREWLHGKSGRVVGEWSKVSPFKDVERSRARYLKDDEAERLLNACEPDFRKLVLGALYTGARYGELARMTVADVDLDVGAVAFPLTKSGKSRHVFLNDEARTFFEAETAGRSGTATLFVKADGTPWGKNHQQRRMNEACKAAKLKPRLVFHELRHTYASLYLMAGGGLIDLAKQLGHSTTRMVEKHYGHLADKWRAEQARRFAPSLGIEPGNVRRLKSGTRKRSTKAKSG